jgi:uncharacterized protein (TIGR03663 family)
MAETAPVGNLTESAPPSANRAAALGTVLDRQIVGTLTLEKCLYLALFGVALLTRLYMLGPRPLHHDESIHAFYSWKITQDGVGSYQYDPVYHGPVLYYWTALVMRLFGDSDFTARLSPVLFGLALLAFSWPMRRYLGRWGALWFLILLTFSPAFTYFTRFLRHDIYVAACNLAFVYFAFRYGETRAPRQMYYAGTALALAFCTKEDMYALAPVFAASFILMLVWEVVHARNWQPALRSVSAETGALLKQAVLPLMTTAILFVVIWLLFYTSMFTHPKNWNGITRALSYWWGQHEIKRIGGPWWYYFPQLVVYDPLIFFPALLFLLGPLLHPGARERSSTRGLAYATYAATAGFLVCIALGLAGSSQAAELAPKVLLLALALAGPTLMRRWLPDRFTRFVVIWTMGSYGFYGWAQEKVPWLLVPILLPSAVLAAMWFSKLVESRAFARPATALTLAAVGALTVWTLIASNYLYNAPRPAEAPGPRHAELLAYVQSTYDITDLVMQRIQKVGATLGTGVKTRLAVSGNATWPLSWYLRHYPVNWSADVRNVDTPIVIVDREASNALDKALAEKYEKVPFQIRGWWEPNWKQLDLPKLVHFLFTREAFSGVGSSDAVMYVLKDLSPGTTLASIAVNPPPAPRGYPSKPSPLAAVAVWGQKGTAAGEFNEPRDLAVDASGNVYVVDSKNNRIQKLSADGKPLLTWGQEGKEPGQFKDPCGIALGPDGSVYVADTWNHRVQKFDANGTFLLQWREQNGFWGPRGVAVSPDGKTVYVTDTGNKRVVSFDSSGKQLQTWGHEGSKPGEFIEPVGITVDANGNVIVADTGNHRVQIFDRDGKFIKEHSVSGWEEFYTEPYIAMLGADLVVTDSYNHRCARYSNGTLVESWGKTGSGNGDFNRPIGIATDAQGAVYVSDTLNNRIQKFILPPAKQ